jgi:hypothetical protein
MGADNLDTMLFLLSCNTPKTAIEAYAIMQQMAITAKMTVQQLAEANGCKSGYELQKKIMSDLNENK